jgi:PAS domain S-box-containing protein
MGEIVASKNQPKQNKKSNIYPIFNWTFDLNNHLFIYDFDAFNFIFSPKKPIKSLSDVLNIMSKEQRKKTKNIIRKVIASKDSTCFSCCLMPNDQTIAYINFYIELDSSHMLKGTFQPSVVFFTQEQIANVYQQMFDNSHHGMLITDDKTRILTCNDYFEKQMGVKRQQLIGEKTNIFNAGKHSPEFYQNMWNSINKLGHWTGTILNRSPTGKMSPHELTIQKIEVAKGSIIYLGITVDLGQQLARVANKELGGIDLLTALPTKIEFIKQLKVFCQKTGQHSGKFVLTIAPNFSLETIYEDQITLSNALLHIRSCQVTGYLGQSNFAICAEYIATNKTPQTRSIRSALRYLFQDLQFHSNQAVYDAVMSGKIGVSILGLDCHLPEDLVSNALKAMNEMHSGEGKRLNFYHQGTHEAIERKKRLEQFVTDVLSRSALEVFYQPIVNSQTGDIVKFEALCRFPAIAGITTNVQELIAITEDLDLITDLDRVISTKAIKHLPQIKSVFGQHVGVSINCSLNTKSDTAEVLNSLAKLITTKTKSPQSITVELTESAYFDSESNTSNGLETLHNLGVNVAIDDFGTGYSSFTYLSNGQFDTLKIDREFVSDIHLKTTNFNIVKMITGLSHSLNVNVIAEGVETRQELECLQKLGVDYIQGYLFSKPKPLNELDTPEHYVNVLKELALFNPLHSALHRIAELSNNIIRTFDPSENLSAAYTFSHEQNISFMPVTVNNKCVGLLSKESINLHLSPTMGTDIETTKESHIWHKTINQIMNTHFTEVLDTCHISEINNLVKSKQPFPWVIVNEKKQYQCIVLESEVLNYLVSS